MRRRKDLSWPGTLGLMMLTLAMFAVVANPAASLAATHSVLAENGSATW
jgi:hypothetical protein